MAKIRTDRLKTLRKELNMTQEYLANLLGKRRQVVNNYENGKVNPDSNMLVALARELACTVDFLLGLSDNRYDDKSIDEDEDWANLKNVLKKFSKNDRTSGIKAFAGFLESTSRIDSIPYREKLFNMNVNLWQFKTQQQECTVKMSELEKGTEATITEELTALRTMLDVVSCHIIRCEIEIDSTIKAYIDSHKPQTESLRKKLSDALKECWNFNESIAKSLSQSSMVSLWLQSREENE